MSSPERSQPCSSMTETGAFYSHNHSRSQLSLDNGVVGRIRLHTVPGLSLKESSFGENDGSNDQFQTNAGITIFHNVIYLII